MTWLTNEKRAVRYLTPARQRRATDLLAELIRTPSVNLSRAQADAERCEEAMAALVAERLTAVGMNLTRHEPTPGRPNLLGRWPGEAAGPPLTLEAHLDTVGVEGMSVEPFGATVVDGRMTGRGACDTKGSLAAFLTAIEVAAEEGWRFAQPIQLAAVIGEETGCEGAAEVVAAGWELGQVIVGEPTSLRVVSAHKGCVWFEVEVVGRAAHGSVPEAGANAIYRMRQVLQFIESDWLPWLAAAEPHPMLGRETCNVGLIDGGEKVNVVPARCRIDLDGRLLPTSGLPAYLPEFERRLAAWLGPEADWWRLVVHPPYPGFAVAADQPPVADLLAAVEAAGGAPEPAGVSYFTDAGVYAAAGWQPVVFGPGDIRWAHGPEEHVALDEVHQAAEVICHLLASRRV